VYSLGLIAFTRFCSQSSLNETVSSVLNRFSYVHYDKRGVAGVNNVKLSLITVCLKR